MVAQANDEHKRFPNMFLRYHQPMCPPSPTSYASSTNHIVFPSRRDRLCSSPHTVLSASNSSTLLLYLLNSSLLKHYVEAVIPSLIWVGSSSSVLLYILLHTSNSEHFTLCTIFKNLLVTYQKSVSELFYTKSQVTELSTSGNSKQH